MECQKCHAHFDNWIKLNGKLRNLSSRKYCLKCSPFNAHNTRKIHFSTDIIEDEKLTKRICRTCKKQKNITEFYYIKTKKAFQYWCKECNKKASLERIQENKRKCIKYKGGKCVICGYFKCDGALDFHHIGKKEFGIGEVKSRSFDNMKKELDKCILVCKNCHVEIEAGITKVPKTI
jgi:hypothetical protein